VIGNVMIHVEPGEVARPVLLDHAVVIQVGRDVTLFLAGVHAVDDLSVALTSARDLLVAKTAAQGEMASL